MSFVPLLLLFVSNFVDFADSDKAAMTSGVQEIPENNMLGDA
jgi:hypothetical protein